MKKNEFATYIILKFINNTKLKLSKSYHYINHKIFYFCFICFISTSLYFTSKLSRKAFNSLVSIIGDFRMLIRIMIQLLSRSISTFTIDRLFDFFIFHCCLAIPHPRENGQDIWSRPA